MQGYDEIITYQEREWRYISNLDLEKEKRLITRNHKEYQDYIDKKTSAGIKIFKSHLPHYNLKIEKLSDIRYILVKTEEEQKDIIEKLKIKFGVIDVIKFFSIGELLILTQNRIYNDF